MWRGSVGTKDKIFAALAYLLPLIEVMRFGIFLFKQIPLLAIIYLPIQPLVSFYYSFPFAGIIIFFILFLAVVRNTRISHFIRFNTMQAILLDILLALSGLLLSVILRGMGVNLLTETLYNVIFLGTLAACGYGIVKSALGSYAEIPSLSEAAYSQVRW